MDREGVRICKQKLTEMLNYFKEVNVHEIRGSSILFVVSPSTSFYDVKLIDLSSFRPLTDDEGFAYDGITRDQGIIFGLTNILSMLDQI